MSGKSGKKPKHIKLISSKRKRAEEALKAAIVNAEIEKNKSEAIIDAIGDGIIIQDTDYKIIYQNQIQNELYGNHVGEYCYKVYEGSDIICEGCPVELVFKDGKIHRSERSVVTDKGVFHFELTGSPLRDFTGKIVAGVKVVRNITERKRGEEALKLFSEAVENAMDGIQIVSLDGHILYSNRAVEKIYGFSHEEYKGKHVNEMNADPEFASRVILPSIMETGQWAGELMVRHKDGRVFPIWLSASIVKNNNGEPIATVGIIKDISERKHNEQVLLESEERYRNLFENSPISLWEEDCSDLKKYIDTLKSKGIKNLRAYFDKYPKEVALCASMVKVVDVNTATLNLFKSRSKANFINGLENIFTEKSYEVFKEELIEIAEGKNSFESEDVVKTLTGDRIHISLKWVLTPDDEKAYSKRLVSIIDITERKRAEEAIKKYARELEESNRMRELFTDIMHHDLMNPLSIAKGYVELLHETETDAQKKAYVETIERNLIKGIELMESTTMLSKLESMESIEFNDMDLKEIVAEVIENLSPMVTGAGMTIENNITRNMPVRANRIIEEVFANIISNAIKYAPEGKKIVLDSEDEGRVWKIRVADFGEGIPDAFKTTIFERFQWVEKKGVKGSGLGLAIARKIMEFHKGRIWVEDNPEGGAIFVVEIPKL